MAKRTTIRIVPPLQDALSQLAKEMDISYNQLVNYALTRFVEAESSLAVLEQRARRGSRTAFWHALGKADRKQRQPDAADTLPPRYNREAVLGRLKRQTQSRELQERA